MKTTRRRLEDLLVEDPEIPAREAAELLGVSRQRIYQLWGTMGARGRIRVGNSMPKVLAGGVRTDLSSGTKGTVGELLAAADLLHRGYQVFMPITQRTASVDLITLDRWGTVIERIEVKSGRRREGRLHYKTPGHDRYDRLAIIVPGEAVVYRPAFAEDEAELESGSGK